MKAVTKTAGLVQTTVKPGSFLAMHRRLSRVVPVLSALFWLAQPGAVFAERSVTLAWNPSQSPGVAGYYLYVLEENSVTPTRITIGNTNQTTVSTLKEGLHYSFTITAFNASGMESVPSNEALFVVPVPLSMVAVSSNGLKRIQFQGAPGRSYELQASSDLSTWSTIWQSGMVATYGPLEYEDIASGVLGHRFYRLVVH